MIFFFSFLNSATRFLGNMGRIRAASGCCGSARCLPPGQWLLPRETGLKKPPGAVPCAHCPDFMGNLESREQKLKHLGASRGTHCGGVTLHRKRLCSSLSPQQRLAPLRGTWTKCSEARRGRAVCPPASGEQDPDPKQRQAPLPRQCSGSGHTCANLRGFGRCRTPGNSFELRRDLQKP